jgi:hypothetical protein
MYERIEKCGVKSREIGEIPSSSSSQRALGHRFLVFNQLLMSELCCDIENARLRQWNGRENCRVERREN